MRFLNVLALMAFNVVLLVFFLLPRHGLRWAFAGAPGSVRVRR